MGHIGPYADLRSVIISSLVLSRFDFDNSICSFVYKNFNGSVPGKTGKQSIIVAKGESRLVDDLFGLIL